MTGTPPEVGPRVPGESRHPAAGYLLNRLGLAVLVGAFLLAAWLRSPGAAILLGIVVCAAALADTWSRVSLWRVTVHRGLGGCRAFPGEWIQVTVRVENRKPLPLPWIHVEAEIPCHLAPDLSPSGEPNPGGRRVTRTASLPWYSAVTWKWRLRCDRRGYYLLRPMRATAGDLFGFYPRTRASGQAPEKIIVYPRIFSMEQLAVPSLHPMGEARADRRILGDPTRAMGIRDYRPDDSLRRIHWKASAHHQQLLVKMYEPTATVRLAVFLAMESYRGRTAWDEDGLELGISTAASFAHEFLGRSCPVGLFVNTRLADSDQPVSIPPAANIQHEAAILEALAKVTPRTRGSFADLVERESRSLPWGTTFALVAGRFVESMGDLVNNLRGRGYRLLLLRAETSAAPGGEAEFPWHRITPVPWTSEGPG